MNVSRKNRISKIALDMMQKGMINKDGVEKQRKEMELWADEALDSIERLLARAPSRI